MLSGAFQATVDERYQGRSGAVTSLADAALIPVALAGFGLLAGPAAACALRGAGFGALVGYALSRRHAHQLRLEGR